MANVKISQLPALSSLAGNDVFPVVSGNVTYNVSANAVANFVGSGGSANTGNVTFNDVNIIGTGNLNLQPDPADAAAYVNIYLTGAADIHMAAGAAGANLILGTDEGSNVAVLQDGNVTIQAGNVGGTKTWAFDPTGNLTLPMGGVVYETNIPDGALSGSAIALKPTGGTTANQQLLIYPTANDGDHIHLTSGNLYSTELYFGSDDLYVKLANTGNVVINSNNSIGNTAQWTFGVDSNLSLPTNGSLNLAGGAINQASNETLLITAFDSDNIVSSSIELEPNNTLTRIEQWGSQDSNSWTTADWATGVYTTQGGGTIGAVEFTGAATISDYVNSLVDVGHVFFSVNGGPKLVSDGYSAGGSGITFYTPVLPATDPTTVTTFEYFYSYRSGLEIDYDSQVFNIYANDADIDIQTSSQNDIQLSSGRDMSLSGNGTVGITNYSNASFVAITANANSGSPSQWQFGVTGNLTLPGNTFAVNYANGTPVSVSGGSSVAEAPFGIQSADFNVTIGNRYGIATGGGSVTATLPATPTTGDAVYFADAAGAYSTNAFIVSPNGGTIMGVSGSMTVTTDGQSFGLFYNGTTWRTYS